MGVRGLELNLSMARWVGEMLWPFWSDLSQQPVSGMPRRSGWVASSYLWGTTLARGQAWPTLALARRLGCQIPSL